MRVGNCFSEMEREDLRFPDSQNDIVFGTGCAICCNSLSSHGAMVLWLLWLLWFVSRGPKSLEVENTMF